MDFRTVPSVRRGQNLIVDNYLFLKKNRREGDTQYYKCVQNTCTSRLLIDLVQNIIVNQPGSHNHFRQVDTENFILPRYNQMRGSRSRKRASCLPPVPTLFDRVKVEGSWTLALNFKRFLLHQEPQILVFATDQGLEFWHDQDICFVMELSKQPPPTLQTNLYPVWGHNGVESASCLGIPWVKKNEAIYHCFFWLLSNKCTEILNIPLVPEFIVTDYDSGVILAVRTVFFGSEQVGCWFHYSQCIYRKIQDIGLSREYSSNEIIQTVSRKLFSLPFLPPNEIVWGFQDYENQLQTIFLVYPSLETLFNQVRNFWIFGNLPLNFWNVFDRPVTIRTTNQCENWNRGWNSDVRTTTPNFWKVLKKLGEQELSSRLDIRRISRGEPPRLKSKKYRNLDNKIVRLKNSYLDGNICLVTYWDGIAAICGNL